MATNRSSFDQLLDKYEPALKAAFLDAIADIRSQVSLKLLVERLERGDVAGAIDVLGISARRSVHSNSHLPRPTMQAGWTWPMA